MVVCILLTAINITGTKKKGIEHTNYPQPETEPKKPVCFYIVVNHQPTDD